MGDFSAIPAGDYVSQIIKSEMKDTKDKKGQYLQLNHKILAGKFKGRLLFSRLNLVNKSAQAVEIANKELATICKAIGKVAIEDSQELHGIPMTLVVTIKPATANYPEGNNIVNYKKASGDVPAEAEPEKTGEDKPAGTKKKKPWEDED